MLYNDLNNLPLNAMKQLKIEDQFPQHREVIEQLKKPKHKPRSGRPKAAASTNQQKNYQRNYRKQKIKYDFLRMFCEVAIEYWNDAAAPNILRCMDVHVVMDYLDEFMCAWSHIGWNKIDFQQFQQLLREVLVVNLDDVYVR